MKMNKKIVVTGLILCSGIVFTAWTTANNPAYKNLKVLPKSITEKELSKIMVDEFNDGLGVSCYFCHAENKITHKPDYASDEKPEKQIARNMMRMMLSINKAYFNVKHPAVGEGQNVVSCITCHNGQAHP
jgi:hypothetical protein